MKDGEGEERRERGEGEGGLMHMMLFLSNVR